MKDQVNRELAISNIILDTSALIKELRSKITLLEELDINEFEIIQLILQSIMFEKDAEIRLANECMTLMKNCLGPSCFESIQENVINSRLLTNYVNDVTSISNATYAFGCIIVNELRRIKAYRDGYLFYQFQQMLDKDIVLASFIPPKITDVIEVSDAS